MREPNNRGTGNNDSASIRRPASAPAFRANEHRAERGGGHSTRPCGRCTRPACSAIRDPFPAIGRKREIGKSPAENCTPRTKGVIATIDRVSLPYIPPMDSRLFSFFLWNWNYWKLIIAWFSWEVSGERKEFRFESGIRGEKNLEEFFV